MPKMSEISDLALDSGRTGPNRSQKCGSQPHFCDKFVGLERGGGAAGSGAAGQGAGWTDTVTDEAPAALATVRTGASGADVTVPPVTLTV